MLDRLLVWVTGCYVCGAIGCIFDDDNNYEYTACINCNGSGQIDVIVD